jgi:hypothetical protein
MKRSITAGLVGAVAAAGLMAAGSAQAAPVFISAAQSTGSGVYIELRVRAQGGTRCKVNLFTRVFFDTTPVRSTGGLGRQSVNACDEENYSVTVPSRISRGTRYVVCVRATNNDNYGQAVAHTSCRRFRG